jgi:hypothetical protein
MMTTVFGNNCGSFLYPWQSGVSTSLLFVVVGQSSAISNGLTVV